MTTEPLNTEAAALQIEARDELNTAADAVARLELTLADLHRDIVQAAIDLDELAQVDGNL